MQTIREYKDEYKIFALDDIVSELGEGKTKANLSSFSCTINPDVQTFLRSKAIEFSKQGLSKTFLVYALFQEDYVLVGYFTISNKFIQIPSQKLSANMRRRIRKFANFNADTCCFEIAAPLLGQIGKNFENGYNKLITGDELLALAIEQIKKAQKVLGGKIIYLEREEVEYLDKFYCSHGFVSFGKRELEKSETDLKGKYLVQMLKYISD